MNPIYKFELSVNGTALRAYPIYSDLAKDFEQESGQQFFREKLSGKLKFESADYARIVAAAFDAQFGLKIYISYNAGQTWTQYWNGEFWKTDCEFDVDAQTVTVTPTVKDAYTDVLAGLENEYNLLDLAPEIVPLSLDKRPILQIYRPGNTSIGQILFGSNTYWETECEAFDGTDLGDMHFGRIADLFPVTLRFWDYLDDEEKYSYVLGSPITGTGTYNLGGVFQLQITYNVDYPSHYDFLLTRIVDNAQWKFEDAGYYTYGRLEYVEGTGTMPALPYVDYDARDVVNIYGRIITDKDGSGYYLIDDDDKVFNNRNYKWCIPWLEEDEALVSVSYNLSSTPTKYGLYQPGQYYDVPSAPGHYIPIAQNSWDTYSLWLNLDRFATYSNYDTAYREENTLKDAYPLGSVISVLLAKFAPNVTHEETADYSQFLYGNTVIVQRPISRLFITPKSNVITLGYEQPAQTAPITLKMVLDMLRDCFRCYWFIDSSGKFRIEHIRYFMLGGGYSGDPDIGINLTEQKVTRNGKPWAFGTDKYQFDKPEMAARYQFGWMDAVTQLFEGYPIDILSKYVKPGNIEEISISNFTSDIDYILLSPDDISKDGFVLLAGINYGRIDIPVTWGTPGYAYNNTGALQSVGNESWVPGVANISQYVGQDIKLRVSNASWAGTCVVDGQGNVLSFIQQYNTEQTITVPAGAVELRISNFLVGTANPELYTMGAGSGYKLPYATIISEGVSHVLQNAYVAFAYLQRYYLYDLPAMSYAINGVLGTALGIKKLKTQSLKFPLLSDPNLVKLVKTNIGSGVIQKLSVNLSSRNANVTLKYDTE